MLRNHEKFWAFIALLITMVLIGLPSLIWDLDDGRVTLADKTMGGLIGVLGVAAGLLFRHSNTDETLAATLKSQADSIPVAGATQEVIVANSPENPAIVQETPTAPTDEEDAPWNKQR